MLYLGLYTKSFFFSPFVSYQRSIHVFPGLAAAGDPNFKTFEAAYPFVVQKLLTENSTATRKILHSVLYSFSF